MTLSAANAQKHFVDPFVCEDVVCGYDVVTLMRSKV